MNKTKINAEIVADSLSPQGNRLTSLLITFPRIVLAEVNTHRMLSKNTSSSRAIPFKKMVESVQNDPFIPIAFQEHHSGMQGTEYLNGIEEENAIDNWLLAKDSAIKEAEVLYSNNVTKQLCNRLLEPFMWTTMLITGSKEGWDNFFKLRCPSYEIDLPISNDRNEDWETFKFKSKKDLKKEVYSDEIDNYDNLEWLSINKGQAEIHIQVLAEKIYDAMNESTPKQLQAGEWHIPFEDKIHIDGIQGIQFTLKGGSTEYHEAKWTTEAKIKISTAMAAHTSYTIVGGEAVKSYEKWIELHDKLVAYDPPHSSPMEHCARAMNSEEYAAFIKGNLDVEIDADGYIEVSTHINNYNSFGWCNNLKGFIPYRYFIDNNLI